MARPLDTANGSILVGTPDPADPNGTFTAATILAASTLLTDCFSIPKDARSITLDIRAAPTAGTGTLAVKVRMGNRSVAVPATLADRRLVSPAALVSISAAVSVTIAVDADCNFIQLELAATGANMAVTVIAAARIGAALPGDAPAGTTSISGSIAVSSLPALVAGTANIGKTSPVLASAIADGTRNVTNAGTRVALSATSIPVTALGVRITAKATNTGTIFVGGLTTVSSTVFMYALLPGQSTDIIPIDNLTNIGLDSSINGEGVSFGAV